MMDLYHYDRSSASKARWAATEQTKADMWKKGDARVRPVLRDF